MQSEEYKQAIQLYLDIVDLGAEQLLEPRSFYDIQWRLASAYNKAGLQQEAEALTDHLRNHTLPGHLFLRNELLAARICKETQRLEKAYALLRDLDKEIGTHEWSPEDRAFMILVEEELNRQQENLLLRAEQYFDGGVLNEAIPLYNSVLASIYYESYPAAIKANSDIELKVRYRLAQALYLEERYQEVTTVLDILNSTRSEQYPQLQDVFQGATYLQALALRHSERFAEALESFQHYLKFSKYSKLNHLAETQWHMGYCYFKLGDFAKARHFLSALRHNERPPRLYHLSQLTLAYMELQEGSLESVEHILSPLAIQLPAQDPLRYEIAYIRGEVHYRLRDYEKAAQHLEASIPERNKRKASWYPNTLYNLAWSYLKIADSSDQSAEVQSSYFVRAEDALKKLMVLRSDERLYLSLAKVYLAQGHRLGDSAAFTKVETLLGTDNTFSDKNNAAESLLLRAEAAGTYDNRQQLYLELTESPLFVNTLGQAYGWYYRGIHEFEEAKRLQHRPTGGEHSSDLYRQACNSLQQSFIQLKDRAPGRAGLALKLQAEAHLNLGSDNDLKQGLALCDTLITGHPTCLAKMEEADEVLYLKGLIASRLVSDEEGEDFDRIAKASLQEVIDHYPEGNFAASSLNLLATLYFHQQQYEDAQRLFLRLASEQPQSPYAGEAWFWASECADLTRKDPEEVRRFRRHAFEQYPDSRHADSAYFNYYSYSEYLQGSNEAIDHLQRMEKKYPDSPLLTVAHYLLGMDAKRDRRNMELQILKEKDLAQAGEHFEEAVKTFDFCYQADLIKESSLEYFITVRYRALLERAAVNLIIAKQSTAAKRHIYLEYAETLYKEIARDFESKQHSLTHYLTAGEDLPRILEEGLYGLAHTYRLAKKDQLAQEVLDRMFEHYQAAGVQKSYYLSRIWYQKGRLHLRQKSYEKAFHCFNNAEDAAEDRVLNTDERLDLWIQQSTCLQGLKRHDESMLMLSKVINEDVASALRIKAMYLRAELYEEQDRADLAIKQLEATANKPGEWALKAKAKLEKDYGYN